LQVLQCLSFSLKHWGWVLLEIVFGVLIEEAMGNSKDKQRRLGVVRNSSVE
jgi:hypothetical protein